MTGFGVAEGLAAPAGLGKVEGPALGLGAGVALPGLVHAPIRTAVAASAARILGRFTLDITSDSNEKRRPREMGNGVESMDQPASYTGTSRIRFGGSVAGATLSAQLRSPEAYSVVQ